MMLYWKNVTSDKNEKETFRIPNMAVTTILPLNQMLLLQRSTVLKCMMALWSSDRQFASGAEGSRFKSLGKALYMHFLTTLMCKRSARLWQHIRVTHHL